jgi:hypothetical protein
LTASLTETIAAMSQSSRARTTSKRAVVFKFE